jgi:hypothetical protein
MSPPSIIHITFPAMDLVLLIHKTLTNASLPSILELVADGTTDTSTGEDSSQEEDEPTGIMKFLIAFLGFVMSLIGGGE